MGRIETDKLDHLTHLEPKYLAVELVQLVRSEQIPSDVLHLFRDEWIRRGQKDFSFESTVPDLLNPGLSISALTSERSPYIFPQLDNRETESMQNFSRVISHIRNGQTSDISPEMAPRKKRNLDRIAAAVWVMHYAHENQKRDSGERYSNHCLRVATTLAEIGLDDDILIAGLLHDTLEDSRANNREITDGFILKVFGSTVLRLVKGCRNAEWEKESLLKRKNIDIAEFDSKSPEVQKAILDDLTLEKIYDQFSDPPLRDPETNEITTDPRIVLIKLADRLDNMRSIRGKRDRIKQMKKARETFEFFVHLAKLLGEGRIRDELTDLSWQQINEEEYREVVDAIYEDIKGNRERNYNRRKVYSLLEELYPRKRIAGQMKRILPAGLFNESNPVSLRISHPGLYAMRKEQEKKRTGTGWFTRDDVYAKVKLIVPDARLKDLTLEEFGHHIRSYFTRGSGWAAYPDERMEISGNDRDKYVFYCRSRDGNRRLRVKVVRKSKDESENAKVADAYQEDDNSEAALYRKQLAVHKLKVIAADHSRLDSLRNYTRHMGGKHVVGTVDNELIPLNSSATLLDLAFLIRGIHCVETTGAFVDGKAYSFNDLGYIPPDMARVKLTFDRSIPPESHVTPIWLESFTDPGILPIIVADLKDRLPGHKEWPSEIRRIGKKIFEKSLQKPEMADDSLYQELAVKTGDSNDGSLINMVDFFEQVAFNQLDRSKVYRFARRINGYIDNHYILEINRPVDNSANDIFRKCCDRLGIAIDHFQSLPSGRARYFLPRTGKIRRLFERLKGERDEHKRPLIGMVTDLTGDFARELDFLQKPPLPNSKVLYDRGKHRERVSESEILKRKFRHMEKKKKRGKSRSKRRGLKFPE